MSSQTPRPGGEPSLHELADTGRLPDHQVMDRPTLDWIAHHRPTGPGVRARLPQRPVLLVPNGLWFTRTQTATSIHGVRHGARVAVLVQLLAAIHGLAPGRGLALAAAAACHDCRRRCDRDDPGHGRRAADWLTERTASLEATFRTAATTEAITAVALHDVPHNTFAHDQERAYRQHQVAVDLLKAADALDRYRLPLARWWPDLNRLRLQLPAWAPVLAHDLVVGSERAHLDGATDTQALEHALQAVMPE
ncbi:hypothetical protein ACFP3U_27100 [Kitasatospora misakiensis]|uniref:HD domain-containing protein n=1 Tax=Kitasatospora misakiensis TaxID=67330 RepID=A0ABW0X9Y9_9ACTN